MMNEWMKEVSFDISIDKLLWKGRVEGGRNNTYHGHDLNLWREVIMKKT